MRILSYDGILAQAIRYLWNLVLLNLCFLLGCLPIFTVGASAAALYSCFLNKSVESGTIKRFFLAFRDNFRQATLLWLGFLAAGAVLGLDYYFLYAYRFAGNGMLRVVTLIITAIYLSVLSFVFPLQAHYDNSPRRTAKNALVLGLPLIFVGLLMTAVTIFPAILFFLSLDVFMDVFILWAPIGLALAAQINSLLLRRIFKKLQPESEPPQTDDRYFGESDRDGRE